MRGFPGLLGKRRPGFPAEPAAGRCADSAASALGPARLAFGSAGRLPAALRRALAGGRGVPAGIVGNRGFPFPEKAV